MAREERTPSLAEIDTIVRRVLAEHARAAMPSTTATVAAAEPALGAHSLCLTERVVTATLLAERLRGVVRVRVPHRAVVTPAARDLLREKQIEIEFAPASSRATKRLLLGLAETSYEPARWMQSMRQRQIEIEPVARVGLAGVVDELALAVALGGERALLFTRELAAGACLANRTRAVRAAAAGSLAELERAITGIDLNLLVLDAAAWSPTTLARAAERMVRPAGEPPKFA